MDFQAKKQIIVGSYLPTYTCLPIKMYSSIKSVVSGSVILFLVFYVCVCATYLIID